MDLKDEYLEARKRNGNEGLQLLRDMAEREIYPDGRFSDEECNVWSMFHK